MVHEYALAWHPTRGGKVRVRTGSRWSAWISVSHEGLAAFAALMREKPLHVRGQWISTGPEPVGEEEA